MSKKNTERMLLVLGIFLTLAVWIVHASYWWVHLEGDNPLFPLMSIQILKGHHFLVTAGQAHGGTYLAYVRALLFFCFGVSHFLGIYINGIVIAVAVALWARFVYRVAGTTSALVFIVLSGIGNEMFVRLSATDYYALSLVCGGLLLNTSEYFSRQKAHSLKHWFLAGILLGTSLYICRFTMLYFLVAALFFFVLCDDSIRKKTLPTMRELLKPLSVLLLGVAFLLALGQFPRLGLETRLLHGMLAGLVGFPAGQLGLAPEILRGEAITLFLASEPQ